MNYFDPFSAYHLITDDRFQLWVDVLKIPKDGQPDLMLLLQEQSRATTIAIAKWALFETVKNSLKNPDKDHFNILREMLVTLVMSSGMSSEEATEFMDEIKNAESEG